MEFKEITRDGLMQERPDLFKEISDAGAAQERVRMQEIDELTPPGCEEMAQKAKEDGETAMVYHKRVIKALRDQGDTFMKNRIKETEPAQAIEGEDSRDHDEENPEDEADKLAKEIAACAPDGKERKA